MLQFIIPIVVYHGAQGWKQKAFSSYFPGLPKDWAAFIPNFHYLLTDLNRIAPEEIEEKAETEYLKNLFLALKFAHPSFLYNWSCLFLIHCYTPQKYS